MRIFLTASCTELVYRAKCASPKKYYAIDNVKLIGSMIRFDNGSEAVRPGRRRVIASFFSSYSEFW